MHLLVQSLLINSLLCKVDFHWMMVQDLSKIAEMNGRLENMGKWRSLFIISTLTLYFLSSISRVQ